MGDKSSTTAPQTLHPVYTVTNIQHKVRVLDGVKVSYPSWVKLFTLHAEGYDVVDHIDGTPAPAKEAAEFASWKKIDAVVLQWIYGTLSDDLLVRVLEDKSTAYAAWERVKNLFLNNKGSRAAALQHELTNLTLSAMPDLDSYCQRIRELADQLAAVDCPLTNTQRILHLVRGLPREYDTTASILNQSLPPWESAVEQLQSEARRISARETLTPSPLVAAAVTSQPHHDTPPNRDISSPPPRESREQRDSRRSSGRRDSNRNHRSYTRQNGQAQSRHYQAQAPFNPYWAPQQQFAPYWAPPPCPFPTQPWAQQWESRPNSRPNHSNHSAPSNSHAAQANLAETDPMDPTSLANTMQALSMDTSGNGQWHFDTARGKVF
ncbi:uncharacterized protein LOC110937409 isoform X2 [Helianthus annuus]|uniref:uncharacterized protein LOC110937409 isoform X2 n=1 Tax=Helianthus annuus TaxID=4232 RepID=UPI001652BF95|nr:uncharacterized protein LOC110937409 isoform X2 [Helianthus annuus]